MILSNDQERVYTNQKKKFSLPYRNTAKFPRQPLALV